MDKYITSFLNLFGEPEIQKVPDAAYVESYRGKLPDSLLEYWNKFGFCSFTGGLFWIVDPAKYESILKHWIGLTNLKDSGQKFYVIARSGYGDLYLWSKESGCKYEINAMNCWVIEGDEQDPDTEIALQRFFGSKSPYSVDLEDEETDDEMFDDAVDRYGKLSDDEMYGFEPTLVTGGDMILDNLKKVDMTIHLDLLVQLQQPRLVTMNDLENMAF